MTDEELAQFNESRFSNILDLIGNEAEDAITPTAIAELEGC